MYMYSCLYHKDKWDFELVQKYLQSSGWIPRQYAHRLAMAVCSCRKFKGEVPSTADLQVQRDFLIDFLKSDDADSKQRPPCVLLQWVKKCLDYTDNYSHARLVTILYNARHGAFRFLFRENVSSNKHDVLPGKKKSGTQKLTATQIECIIRKRQRKKYVSQLVKLALDMFPGNKQKLEEHLTEQFLKTNRGYLDYRYPRELNNRSFENNLTVTCRNVVSLNSITTVLLSSSRDLQRRKDNMRTARRERRTMWSGIGQNSTSSSSQAELGVGKDQLWADFDLKLWKQIKEKKQPKKPAGSVLKGGHCLQCFQSFASLKDNSTCTYHPGYLNTEGVWSCCSEKSDLDSHTETGCVTSDQHKWRRHAKRSRSNEKKVKYTEQQFARTRHVKHHYAKHERHRK